MEKDKFKENEIRQICELIMQGKRNCEIVELLGVKKSLVSDIKIRRTWTHISEEYNW